jgi:hypothetical protein
MPEYGLRAVQQLGSLQAVHRVDRILQPFQYIRYRRSCADYFVGVHQHRASDEWSEDAITQTFTRRSSACGYETTPPQRRSSDLGVLGLLGERHDPVGPKVIWHMGA